MIGKILALSVVITMLSATFFLLHASAAGPMDLAGIDNFAIFADTYTNPGTGTILNGDLGYRIPPGNPPTVTGTTYVSTDTAYISGQSVLTSLLANANDSGQTGTCTATYGAIDLVTISPLAPGVYCFTGAISIGSAGITLSGDGLYIFRINGALVADAGSHVTLTNNTKIKDVFWSPQSTTTLGDGSFFAGNIITTSATTLGSTVSMTGRILSTNTVTTSGPDDVILAPTCGLSPSPASLDYSTVSRNEQSSDKQLVLANTGSVTTSIQVKGNDWTGNSDSVIHLAVGKTRYAFGTTGTPDPTGVSYLSKTALTTSFAGTDAVIGPSHNNNTYWQLEVSDMQNLPFSGTISQIITFTFSCLI